MEDPLLLSQDEMKVREKGVKNEVLKCCGSLLLSLYKVEVKEKVVECGGFPHSLCPWVWMLLTSSFVVTSSEAEVSKNDEKTRTNAPAEAETRTKG